MYSLLIKNAKIIDGISDKAFTADVAVQGDEIVNVAADIKTSAQTVIDAAGKTLAPGFVDIQNHSDSYWQLFDNPSLDSLITQGYTSVLIGNCGASLAPLLSHDALLSVQKWHSLEGANINWQTFSEYLEQLSRQKFACNIGTLVGYSTLRRGVVGDQIRSLEKSEMAALKQALEQSLKAGAFGLSNGLSYAHEIIISELELYELAKIVSKAKGLFSVHLRSEGGEILEALDEALDIARNTEVNLKISHFKVKGEQNWPKFAEAMEHLDTACHQGLNVQFDVYPYDTVWQVLYSYLPKWAIEGGRAIMLKHFADPVQKNKILTHLNNSNVDLPQLMVASTTNKLNFVGKTVGQIAKNMEVSSEQAILHLVQNGGSEVLVFEKSMDPAQVEMALCHPLAFVGTDGGGFGLKNRDKLVHPRCFGTATKFIRNILQTGSLDLPQAIKKLASGPAKKAGFKRRGEIKIGNFADLVLFDEQKIKDNATYENPYQFSSGIDYVFVNGRIAVRDNQPTGDLPGYVLRKS